MTPKGWILRKLRYGGSGPTLTGAVSGSETEEQLRDNPSGVRRSSGRTRSREISTRWWSKEGISGVNRTLCIYAPTGRVGFETFVGGKSPFDD